MLSILRLTALVVMMIFGITRAHMIMQTPKPFGNPDNSPLANDGSDFPCKQVPGIYDNIGPPNIMPIGVNQTLSFIGTATHGGGSCQISLTKDANPTKNSTWMVIHSIIGGCPANVPANLEAGEKLSTFQFSIPEGISAGDYVLAWTWFNRMGNREMYMNCAAVTVTSGSKRRRYQGPRIIKALAERATFPNIFVAEVPCGTPCTLTANFDVNFPNPGKSVEFAGDPQNLKPPPTACPPEGGYPNKLSPSCPAANTSSPSTAANISSTSTLPPGTSACSTPDAVVCSTDGSKFGKCDITYTAVMLSVAAGTKCVDGQIVAAGTRRAAKRLVSDGSTGQRVPEARPSLPAPAPSPPLGSRENPFNYIGDYCELACSRNTPVRRCHDMGPPVCYDNPDAQSVGEPPKLCNRVELPTYHDTPFSPNSEGVVYAEGLMGSMGPWVCRKGNLYSAVT